VRSRLLVLTAVAAALLAGCSSAAPATTTSPTPTPSASNPYGAAAIDPLGPDEPVLVVTGGSAGTVELTVDELEALGTTTVTVYEPFVKTQQTFTGVPLSAVFDRAGISADQQVDTIALNDYVYSDLAGDLEASDGLVATRREGEPIPYDQGGPVRLIFPDGSALAGDLDAWNWSVAEIAVSAG
jgi:hypothetical protein